jgi:WD40 repeat protein/serine/threonine protein kinase
MMDNRSWPGRLLKRKSEQNVPSKQAYFSRNTPYADGMEAAVPAIWRKGDIILDQYEVIGTLGEGGMGKVYKVHHRGWNTDLAVKSPKPEIFAKADGKENFIREAETWINLGLHPHIVSCYYVRTLGGIPRIFAEYLTGGSLADWIGKRKLYEGGHKQALERILDVAIQFAWGLDYAHQQGLVHQDVKPANVMMASDGTVKVTDFGLAKARAMAGEVGIQTASGAKSVLVSSRGMTPAYCSPEQATGQALSRRTDIWSWGVSVLEMFVGSVTWMVGVVAREVLACHETQDPVIPAMPAAVGKLLARCFQPRPQDRPATMLEVATVLQEIYERELEHPYPRQAPKVADALADNLNNRALSLYDLGKIEEAKQVWQQALQADPHHIEATYNQGITLWRQGRLTDNALVRQLEEVRATQSERWQPNYLLALVQIERGDGDTALSLLRETAQRTPEQKEVRILLERVQSGAHPLVRCLRTFSGHTGSVTSVCLSADGRFALSGSDDQSVRLWEVASGQCLRTFSGHTDWVASVSLNADGRFALSGSLDNTLRLWEVASGGCLRTFSGHASSMTSVSLSANCRWALSGSSDKTMRLWDIASGQCLHTFEHTDLVTSVCLSADARLALSGSLDKTMRLWELPQERFVCPVRLSQVWSHTDVLYIEAKVVGLLQQAEQSHVAKALGLLSQVRALPGWERAPKSLEAWARFLPHCSKASLSAGWLARTFIGHTEEVTSVCLCANGQWALSGSLDKTMRLWEVASGQCLRTFSGHTYSVTSVCLSANDRWALSGSYDKTMRLWEVTSGQCLRTFTEHAGSVKSVNLSADSRWALSGSWDTTMRLWEVASGECLRTFTEHTERVSSVSLSANGRWALSGSHDKTVRLWELDWELEARELTDWDEGAQPYLEIFLTQHTPYASMLPQDREPSEQEVQQALTRRGRPS